MTPIRVLALYDYKGWAWWHRLRQVRRHLPADIDLDIREVYENFPHKQYDFFLLLEEYLLPLLHFIPADKIIAGSSCARIACKAASAQKAGRCLGTVFNSLEMYRMAGPMDRIYCCQNGVDTELFTPADRPPDTFTACWIGNGRSICEKGLDIIQAACTQADVPLLYRDQSREREPLSQEEIRDRYYRKASVYLCASQWEGTPNPALEALSCGLPVIATPVGNMPEILVDGRNGFLVQRTVEDCARALRQIRNMDQAALRAQARQSVLNGWTWAQQAQKYAAMFRDLAGGKQLASDRFTVAGRQSYMEYLFCNAAARLLHGHAQEAFASLAWACRYTPLWRAIRHAKIGLRR